MVVNQLACCAASEIAGLNQLTSDPNACANALWEHAVFNGGLGTPRFRSCRYMIFTQARYPLYEGATSSPNGYGAQFAQFIRDANLGEVIDSIPEGPNPNTNNLVKMWVWIINWVALTAWLNAEAVRRQPLTPPTPPIPPIPHEQEYDRPLDPGVAVVGPNPELPIGTMVAGAYDLSRIMIEYRVQEEEARRLQLRRRPLSRDPDLW